MNRRSFQSVLKRIFMAHKDYDPRCNFFARMLPLQILVMLLSRDPISYGVNYVKIVINSRKVIIAIYRQAFLDEISDYLISEIGLKRL